MGRNSMASLHSACGCGAVHSEVGSCPERWSRRGLLRSGAALTAALMAGGGAEIALPKIARAQTQKTPHPAPQTMMDGNKRLTQGQKTSFNHDLKMLKGKKTEAEAAFGGV